MITPSWEGRRILVTGAAGFLGRHLLRALADGGASVAALDLEEPLRQAALNDPLPDGARALPCDLSADDVGAIVADARPDVVFHLAGHASVPASFEHPGRDFAQNVVATFALLEAVRLAAPRAAVVNVSSAAVYGLGADEPLRESRLPTPTSPYGASKRCAELYLEAYCRAYGLRGATVRLFALYGPGLQRHVIFDLLVKLTRNPASVEVIGDGQQVREFLHVADAVNALLTVAEHGGLEGELYNAAGGTPVTVQELVGELAAALGCTPRILFTGSFREGARDRWVADGERLQALGFTPQVSMEEGIRGTVEWFRAHVAPDLDTL